MSKNSSSAPTTVTRILQDANFQAGFRDARAGRAFAIDDHQERGDKWAYERGWLFARLFPSVRRLDAEAVRLLRKAFADHDIL
jgi:hypothetical protein